MQLLLLALIFVPFTAYAWAQKVQHNNLWAITGASFGVIVYPLLAATTIPLMYGGWIGNAILSISNPLTIFHRLPGKILFHLINGHPIRDDVSLFLFALNAVVWGVVYGVIGWNVDQGKSKRIIKFLIILCCVSLFVWILVNLKAFTSLLDEVVDGNSYGYICQQVVDADENAVVWMRIGNLRSSTSEKAMVGKQLCSKVNVTKGPFQVLLGDIQHPSVAMDIPIAGGKKTCIGLTPKFPDASSQSADWTAKIIDCPPER